MRSRYQEFPFLTPYAKAIGRVMPSARLMYRLAISRYSRFRSKPHRLAAPTPALLPAWYRCPRKGLAPWQGRQSALQPQVGCQPRVCPDVGSRRRMRFSPISFGQIHCTPIGYDSGRVGLPVDCRQFRFSETTLTHGAPQSAQTPRSLVPARMHRRGSSSRVGCKVRVRSSLSRESSKRFERWLRWPAVPLWA